MKVLITLILLFSGSCFADEKAFITKAVVQDIETFSETYNSEEIKVIEADSRFSFNPFQWLLMVKDLAAGEKRKVITFKYKEKGEEEIKRGYTVLTYEASEQEDELCYKISLNKLNFDTGVINISGVFPGFKTIRIIEKCQFED